MLKKIISICLLLAGMNLFAQSGDRDYPAGIEHVIVIGVDGMSPDGIRNAKAPVIHDMITHGSVKWNVRTVLPSSSSSNWASMIMGAGVEHHGITSNGWEKDSYTLPPIVMNDEGIFPTIFGVVRAARPTARIGAVYNWKGFGRLFEKKAVNYDRTFSTEDSTTDDFVRYIKQDKPLFAFLHLDHVDHAGHTYGHGSDAYYQSISKTDTLVGRVLSGIKAAGIEKNTLVIITSDHGGLGYGHGGASPEEAEIAMILYGKGVKKGYQVPEQVVTYDLAATIAFALKVTPPYVWIGRPIKSAFEGFAPPANLGKWKTLIPAPVIQPKRHLYQQPGGLYVNREARVVIEPVATDAVIRYTIDGSEPDSRSPLYQQPFTLKRSAVVRAKSFSKTGSESLVNNAYFRIVDSTKGHGLRAQFYQGKDWSALPPFDNLSAANEWHSYEFILNREHIHSLLEEGNTCFAVLFTGYIQIDRDGKYRFYSSSDDGSKLFIDGKEVVDNDGQHGLVEESGSIELKAGRYPIRVEYYNSHGGFWLDAFYAGPGLPKQLIPADKLFLRKN